MGQVKFTFTGDKSQLEQAYKDLAKSNANLQEKVEKLSAASKRGNDSAISGARRFDDIAKKTISSVAGLVSTWFSVSAAVNAATSSVEEFKKINEESRNFNASIGKEQAQLAFNLANISEDERKNVYKSISEVNQQTQFGDIRQLTQAMNSALSTTGGNINKSIELLNASAPLARNSPESMTDIVQGAGKLMNDTGMGAKEAISFMLSAGGPSAVIDPRKQSLTVPQGVGSSLALSGATTQEERIKESKFIAAQQSAIGSVAGDTTGEASVTAVTGLNLQIRDILKDGLKRNIGGHTFTFPFENVPDTVQGRFEYIQNLPDEKRDDVIKQLHGEDKFRPAIEQLFTKDGVTNQRLKEFLPLITTDEKVYERLAETQRSGTPQIQLATNEAGDRAGDQDRMLKQTPKGLMAQAKSIRDKVLIDTRDHGEASFPMFQYATDAVESQFRDFTASQKLTSSIEGDIAQVERRRKSLLTKRNPFGSARSWESDMLFFDSSSRIRKESELTMAEREDLKFLDEKLLKLNDLKRQFDMLTKIDSTLTQQNKLIEGQTKLTEEQNNILRGSDRPTGNPQADIGRHR